MHLLSPAAVLRTDVTQDHETAMTHIPFRLAQRSYGSLLRHRLLTVTCVAVAGVTAIGCNSLERP